MDTLIRALIDESSKYKLLVHNPYQFDRPFDINNI
jgi:hypothetical protein